MKTTIAATTLLAISLLALSADADDKRADKIIDAFLTSIDKNDSLSEEVRTEVNKTVETLRKDEYGRSAAIAEGLRIASSEFRAAIAAMEEDEIDAAIELLQPLKDVEDPFLAAEAAYFTARALIYQERYEESLPHLNKIIGKLADSSLSVGDALFLQGVAESEMLNRPAAINAFETFLEKHPEASERMRVGAWRQLEQLKQLEEGSIADVFDRMDFSRRRLVLGDSGERTQEEQDRIIDMLAKLIEQAEEAECNCQGSKPGEQEGNKKKGGSGGGSPGEGTGKNGKGGNDQTPGAEVRRTFRRGPQSPWHKVRDKDRDPAYNAIKTRFPARYEQLIKQYYESFQTDES